MGIQDRALELLVAHDPRRSADASLGLLLAHLRADAAGLFEIVDERLSLFVGRGVDQVDLDRALEAWEDGKVSILAGQTYSDHAFALVPIGNGDPLGVLYVGSRRTLVLDPDTLDAMAPVFSTALEASRTSTSAVDAYLERTPVDQIAREQLLLLLNRNEWNISRVARIKGVTRLTIYKQMARYGIDRRRVAKDRRGRTAVKP